ncbi:MAG: hypothetical protein KDC79_02390 [Cyclobacteriaceae bacterium]|nr:hypothetical protein [Cyclobacteriaceae bacterium]
MLTSTIKQASELISIRLLDHLIICSEEGSYYSFADSGKNLITYFIITLQFI